MPLLSLITFTPLAGALILMLMPKEQHPALRRGAFVFSLVPFALSVLLLALFNPNDVGFQFRETVAWIPQFGISYSVGIDGISIFLLLLTTFLTPLVILAGWGDIHKRVKEYMIFLLLMETGMVGAFVALDLFLFYVFWEVMLIPMYFLIGVWGGERRIYAALKLILYTMTGSLLMLVAILYMVILHGQQTGQFTFDLLRLYDFSLPLALQRWLFAAFAFAFAIKVPMFPLHTWLPDAHTEAPTGGSVILAGVLLKMGTYGFLRFAIPLFPLAAREALRPGGVLAVNFMAFDRKLDALCARLERSFDGRVLLLEAFDRVNVIALAFRGGPFRIPIKEMRERALALKATFGLPFERMVSSIIDRNRHTGRYVMLAPQAGE